MKKCKICGVRKDYFLFYKQKKTKDGYRTYCKQCYISYQSKYKSSSNSYLTRKRRATKYGISVKSIALYGFQKALLVYEKYNRKCGMCGSEYDLTIHHKDGNGRHNREKGLPTNDNSENLMILCRRCHGSIHGKEGGRHHKKER